MKPPRSGLDAVDLRDLTDAARNGPSSEVRIVARTGGVAIRRFDRVATEDRRWIVEPSAMHHPSFYPDHPHLRSDQAWELCDEGARCPHVIAARCRRHFRRIVALVAAGLVTYPTICACFIETSVAWIAGTFVVSSIFAGAFYIGLCADRAFSDIPVVDRET